MMNLSNDCGQTKTAWDIIIFGLDTHMGDMSVDFKKLSPTLIIFDWPISTNVSI